MKGSEAIVGFLESAGVETVFGVGGETAVDVMDAIRGNGSMEYLHTRHEQGGALAASGYAKHTGRPVGCLAHKGSGVTNLPNGVADAFKDSVPVVVLTCNAEARNIGRGVWQAVEHLELFDSITDWQVRVPHVDRIPQVMREAMTRLNTGSPGPILVDVPKDIAAAELPPDVEADVREARDAVPGYMGEQGRTGPSDRSIDEAVRRFRGANDPVLVAGGGTFWSGAGPALASLAEYAKVPLVTTMASRGIVSEYHDYCLGAMGRFGRRSANEAIEDADLVIAIGTVLGTMETFGWTAMADADIVQVDLSEGEIGRQYSVAQGIVADARMFVERFEAALRATDATFEANSRMEEYREATTADLEAALDPPEGELLETERVHPWAIIAAVGGAKEPGDVLLEGAGRHAGWVTCLPVERPGTYLRSDGLGTMGFATPAAMGALVGARDDGRDPAVFALVGDGDFSQTCQEICTCAQLDIPICVVVFNNEGLQVIKDNQERKVDGRLYGTDYDDVDYAAMARAFGAEGVRVESIDELDAAVDDAAGSDRPVVIDVKIEPAVEFPSFSEF